MGQPLDNFRLQRVIPGITQGWTQEWGHAIPLRMRPQRLVQWLIRWESRINAVGICQAREPRDHLRRINWQRQKRTVARIRNVEPVIAPQTFRRERIVVLACQHWSGPPHPAISNVSDIHQQVRLDLTLHPETPMNLARWAARIPIN